jgi:hypothetical protein
LTIFTPERPTTEKEGEVVQQIGATEVRETNGEEDWEGRYKQYQKRKQIGKTMMSKYVIRAYHCDEGLRSLRACPFVPKPAASFPSLMCDRKLRYARLLTAREYL